MHLTAFQMGSDERGVVSVLEKGGANHYRGNIKTQLDESYILYNICLLGIMFYDTETNVPQFYSAIVGRYCKKTSKAKHEEFSIKITLFRLNLL